MANLVGGSVKQTPEQIAAALQQESRHATELNERTRLLEERGKQLMQKLQVVDETSMKKISDLRDKMQSIESQISGLRKEFEETKEILRRVAKELEQTAKMSDVKVLEKYINMVDITRLIMKDDVLKIIEEYMETHHQKKK
jgi:uncharacterized protein (DUF342 family)